MTGEITDDDYCLHELPKGQCANCKPPPRGVNKTGYRIRYGQVFHNDRNCDLLREGQRRYARRDREPSQPTPIHWVDAQALGLGQCLGCCAPQWPTGQDALLAKLTKLCWVNVEPP
ncbi:hypothetical protein LWC34_31040 [Kibdelosporangium philippinense]|uniref:Uncharacterized protein n=1 Tax=Kibdelosporangium philippinense TaxID=211113 RepID=A0ABS8ZIJ9_9PSEU|nr:hypothetical protein [Kibdelosporangium philippinense]MCE7007224.1 hypothetical protein [Kibdelosporangium philippinense]